MSHICFLVIIYSFEACTAIALETDNQKYHNFGLDLNPSHCKANMTQKDTILMFEFFNELLF